jgi:hypothetical protein
MPKRPTLTIAAGNPQERRAFLLRLLLPVLVARPVAALPVDPKQTFVLQHGDIKFVPREGLPPKRLSRRRLAQGADRAAESDQPGMILA